MKLTSWIQLAFVTLLVCVSVEAGTYTYNFDSGAQGWTGSLSAPGGIPYGTISAVGSGGNPDGYLNAALSYSWGGGGGYTTFSSPTITVSFADYGKTLSFDWAYWGSCSPIGGIPCNVDIPALNIALDGPAHQSLYHYFFSYTGVAPTATPVWTHEVVLLTAAGGWSFNNQYAPSPATASGLQADLDMIGGDSPVLDINFGLTAQGTANTNLAIDNVQLSDSTTAAPEPGTSAMLLLACCLLGSLTISRRRSGAA